MPLHEYEENKRRRNIDALIASGACHICGSTARNTKGFSHCIDYETRSSAPQQYHYNDMGTSLIPAPQTAPMRSCACFGQSKSDPDYWPYSLRVCEMCIADDCTTGRVRNCGICGAVACDENCGVELVECTDSEGWNNMGCLECRRKECFSEIDIFRTSTKDPEGRDVPRMTRVCVKCVEKCTPWVKYDFTCRLFRCNTRLVPSDVMERKRFRTFGSSPLNLLPEDGLAAVVDFLSNKDLKALYLTNSAMCTIAERVAQTRVESFNHEFPTGPLVVGTRKSPYGRAEIPWTRCEGTNDFNVRAPEDGKFWVGILHHLEHIAKNAFSFGFQTQEDPDVVCRFMQRRQEDKFQFSQVYKKEGQPANPTFIPRTVPPTSKDDGIMIRSSHTLITNESAEPFTVASSEDFVAGTQRLLCRLFCPGSGTKSNNRDAMGSYGILCKGQNEDGGANITWAKRVDIWEGSHKEDSVFGLQYTVESREMKVHAHRINRIVTCEYVIPAMEGELVFAIELGSKAMVPGSLLSVRKCDEDEWAKFLELGGDVNNDERGGLGADFDRDQIDLLFGHRRRAQEGGGNRAVRARIDINDDDDDDGAVDFDTDDDDDAMVVNNGPARQFVLQFGEHRFP